VENGTYLRCKGTGTSVLVLLNPEKLLERGLNPAAFGKKFARGKGPTFCSPVPGTVKLELAVALILPGPGSAMDFASEIDGIELEFIAPFEPDIDGTATPGPTDILRGTSCFGWTACAPPLAIICIRGGLVGGAPDCGPFPCPWLGPLPVAGGGGSTLNTIGTGPSAAPSSASVRPYIVGPRN
jgi:hypothetical protein